MEKYLILAKIYRNPFLFILFGLMLMNNCFAQLDSTACTDFHTGKFSYFDSLNHKVLVTRRDHKQVEYNQYTKVTVKLKINWINDCEYELKQVWSDSKSLRKYNGAITRVMITKITGDKEGYEYSCACKEETDRVRSKGIMRREF